MLPLHLLNLQECLDVYPMVEQYLPDGMRNPNLWATSIHAFGFNDGVVWLSDIRIGHRANIHVVTWGSNYDLVKHDVVQFLMGLYNLVRLEALIPSRNYGACRLAETLGFTYEGMMKKADKYDGQFVDMAIYAKVKEG